MADLQGYKLVNEESVSARTATPSVAIGERRTQNGNDFMYVYNGSTNQIADLGRGVKMASQSTGFTVDVDTDPATTITADICVGVVQNATIATGEYGWIMTRGHAINCANMLSAVVTGQAVYMTTSGAFRRTTAASSVPGQGTKAQCGRAMTGPSAATTNTATFDMWIEGRLA